MGIGYDIYHYDNKTGEIVYHEEAQIPSDTGISLCLPSKPFSYSINLKPKTSQSIIYKQTYEVFTQSQKLGFNSILGDDQLIAICNRDGAKKRRSNKHNIYSKEYLYEKGKIMIYKNKTRKKKTLIETLVSDSFDLNEKEGQEK